MAANRVDSHGVSKTLAFKAGTDVHKLHFTRLRRLQVGGGQAFSRSSGHTRNPARAATMFRRAKLGLAPPDIRS